MDTKQEFPDRVVRGYDLPRLEENVRECSANILRFQEAIKKEQKQIQQLSDIIRRKRVLDATPAVNEVRVKPQR
jgi:hypothetical protein